MTSLSAVSEAPTSRDLLFRSAVNGRFRYSDLKEAAPRGSLWVLYRVEQVRMICKVAVGSCGWELQREICAWRRVAERLREGCSAFWAS
jgi:hypothetical protein